MTHPTIAIVCTGGGSAHPNVPVPRHDLVIAADSGLHVARALDLRVDLLVGDLDSVDPEAIGETPVELHRVDKDATDLELAIDAAVARGAQHIVIIGGSGNDVGGGDGRLDHLLGELLLLAAPRAQTIEAWLGPAWFGVVHGPGTIAIGGRQGETVTLVPMHGPAAAISTSGLRFPLDHEALSAGTTRGLSNERLAGPASATVGFGTVMVVRPFALESPSHPIGPVAPPVRLVPS